MYQYCKPETHSYATHLLFHLMVTNNIISKDKKENESGPA